MESEALDIEVAAFYRFVDLPDRMALKPTIEAIGSANAIRGTVLLAPEGINSTVSGERGALGRFFAALGEDSRFRDFEQRRSTCHQWPFRKWRVRLKKEIVRMKVDAANPRVAVGEYVDPADWNAVIADPDLVVVDVRNRYEIAYGTFESAVDPMTDDFWEFPKWVEAQELDPERPIAMFCTGGIRCERASAYLLSQGFQQVLHLKGGILNYLESVPASESRWRGSCFVFDDREALDHDLRSIRESV